MVVRLAKSITHILESLKIINQIKKNIAADHQLLIQGLLAQNHYKIIFAA